MAEEEVKRERLRLTGTREEKIATAKRIKTELEEHLPDMAELHRGLVELGMCDGTMGDIGVVITPTVAYNKYQDDPTYLRRKFNQPTTPITEEDRHAIQDRTRQQIESARLVRDSGRGHRRR